MSLEDLRQQLESAGFQISPNHLRDPLNRIDWYAHRLAAAGAKVCQSDQLMPTVTVFPTSILVQGEPWDSVEVELRGAADGILWQLRAYALTPDAAVECLPAIETKLIGAWNALQPG